MIGMAIISVLTVETWMASAYSSRVAGEWPVTRPSPVMWEIAWVRLWRSSPAVIASWLASSSPPLGLTVPLSVREKCRLFMGRYLLGFNADNLPSGRGIPS
ncbi:hypothetical protein FQZ97_1018370 [compost metagenome]